MWYALNIWKSNDLSWKVVTKVEKHIFVEGGSKDSGLESVDSEPIKEKHQSEEVEPESVEPEPVKGKHKLEEIETESPKKKKKKKNKGKGQFKFITMYFWLESIVYNLFKKKFSLQFLFITFRLDSRSEE